MEVGASADGWLASPELWMKHPSTHAPMALTPASKQDAPSGRITREQVEILILGHFSNCQEKCLPRRAEHR